MIKRVLIMGGYGNFGSFITKTLAQEKNIQVIIAGRSSEKILRLASHLNAVNKAETVVLDIKTNLINVLTLIKPDIVILTCGPFQMQSYDVAKACITQGCHYIDLADGRDFVNGVGALNDQAKAKAILLISGASSVPCLTAALIDDYAQEFHTLAQQTARGLATTAAILSYTGKPFKTLINGMFRNVYGWQGLRIRKYQNLGWRLLGNCDVPDLILFPQRYPGLKTVRFYAGLEIPLIHITLWALSWFVRTGLIKNLQMAAPILLKCSHYFDWLGTANSGFHLCLSGKDKTGVNKRITFELIARSGDGPYIPCMPAILMTKKIANGDVKETGAFPCVGFITKDEYLNALSGFDIHWEQLNSSSNGHF